MTETKFPILASYCGEEKTLTLPSFLTLLEEISIKDVIKSGLDRTRTLDKGFLWVISRVVMKINRVPLYDEKVRLVSFAMRRMRSLFPRGYILYDEKGEILIEAEALWGLIEEKSRVLIDPAKEKIFIRPSSTPSGFSLSDLDYSLSPYGELHHLGVRKVKASDLDLNCHMSNYRYGEWWMDEIEGHPFSRLSTVKMAFFHELKQDDSIELCASEDGGAFIGSKRGSEKAFVIQTSIKS